MALRQVGCEARVEGRVEVIRHAAVAGQHLGHDRLTVGNQPERLTDPHIRKGRHVDRHAQRQPATARRLEHRQVGVRLDHGDLTERDVRDGIELTAQQRVDLGRGIGEVDDRDLVEIGLAGAPVVGVPGMAALLARREAVQLVRAGAILRTRVSLVPDRHDSVVVLPQLVADGRVRALELQADGAIVHLGHAFDIDRAQSRVAEQSRIGEHSRERVDDVIGPECLAVVERDPLLHADRPLVRRVLSH